LAESAYLDFVIEIGKGEGLEYPVSVLTSPAGEAREIMRFPFDRLALENHLLRLKYALLKSGGKRRLVLSPDQQDVRDFGTALFNALFCGEARNRYDVSLERARQAEKRGLRIKLRVQDARLAALPWEFLCDPRKDYLCLSNRTPLVRYLELPEPPQPLAVQPPLRILGMVASPSDLPALDVGCEKQRVEAAIESLRSAGKVELTWLEGATWHDLQRALRGGPWHIFHFIGHGGYDTHSDQGLVALCDESGKTFRLLADKLGRLLANHPALRLVFLNACEGARGGETDIFSSTASILVRRGIPAVAAMQYEITDDAAIQFSRSFYEALADGLPVDAAISDARLAIDLSVNNSLEWGTPVLHLRAPDGALFALEGKAIPHAQPAPPPVVIHSDGGTVVVGDVHTDGGDFVGRDKIEQHMSPTQLVRQTHEAKDDHKPTKKDDILSEHRFLEASMADYIPLGIAAKLTVIIRMENSKTLLEILKEDPISNSNETIATRPIITRFRRDQHGVISNLKLGIKLISPDFSPPSQSRSILLQPGKNSDLHTFLVTPKKTGQLLINLEVHEEDVCLASREIHTTSVENNDTKATTRLTSIPIIVNVYAGNISTGGGDFVGHDEITQQTNLDPVEPKIQITTTDQHPPESSGTMSPPVQSTWLRQLFTGVVRHSKTLAIAFGMITLLGVSVMQLWNSVATMPGPITPPTQVSEKDGMKMVYVPAGEFSMGAENTGVNDDNPAHAVSLDAFWIDQTEVTHAMYRLCVTEKECEPPSDATFYNGLEYVQHPVVYVSWEQADGYCRWAGRRLPSEAEWEKAARGTDGRIYPWGNQEPDKQLANFGQNQKGTTSVGRYSPQGDSAYGCADMAGNVWEWVQDWYGADYYKAFPRQNPTGPINGTHKVVRGGSWHYDAYFLRSAYRSRYLPDYSDGSLGFRCVVSAGK